ncbi:8-oxo-dGTP diphosphatase MutT [Reinekea sp.]|jgi:8-oxo-dGTP diphosphatase|uniref:8-oxo-dGTP diphosphatase MutT n=1 Tax=Reinekea sp. TaxID=1970455 RepID=UPI00398A1BE4
MALQVSAAILVSDQKIFAARRAPGRHLAGYWEFPGGKIEESESPEQCLKRELAEELAISATIGPFLMKTKHRYATKIVELHAYWVTDYSGNIQLKDHDELTWLAVNDLNSVQWAPADEPIVEEIRRLLVQ